MIRLDPDAPLANALAVTIEQKMVGWPRGLEQQTPNAFVAAQAFLAGLVSAAVLDAYRRGEMDLLQVLEVLYDVGAPIGRENQIALVGDAAIKAIEMPLPKDLHRSKPPFPNWVKRLAVDLALSFREGTPSLPAAPAKSARLYVTGLLFRLGLLGTGKGQVRMLSEATLRKWCSERLHETGETVPRGRPRKRK